MHNVADADRQKKPTHLWIHKLLTMVLTMGAATAAAFGLAALTPGRQIPSWLALIAGVVFVAAYVGATRLAKTIRMKSGFVLDALVGIPLGVFFFAAEKAFPVRDGVSGALTNIVFAFIVALNLAGYFYTRYPRQHI